MPEATTIPNAHAEPLPFSTSQGTPQFTDNFVFGDSFSETNFDIYGEQPSDTRPLGNSNNKKPVWVDYLSSKYTTPSLRTFNFARGGSVIDGQLVQNTVGTSLDHQIHRDFLPLYSSANPTPTPSSPVAAHWAANTTLFTLWFGINDVVLSADASIHAPLDAIFTSYRASLEALHLGGARNFLFLNVPPVHHVYKMKYDTADLQADIHWFNKRLLLLRQDFLRAHADTVQAALYLDVHELWTQVISAPQSFALTRELMNTKTYCLAYLLDDTQGEGADVFDESCKWPLSSYFWQNLHVTAKVQEITAATLVADCLGTTPKGYCS